MPAMESSPPTRAWEHPGPEDDSQYSLDLGALDMDTVSDMDVPKPQVDRIFSEDIDGPSDFTQNMELWMRGGPASRKGTLKSMKSVTRTIQEDMEEEEHDAQKVATPAFPGKETDEDRTQSDYTPENSPPKVSGIDETVHEDQFSSEWNTYGSTSTPAPPVHKQFLQPTVEDYNSELSPARQTPAQTARGRRLHSHGILHQHSASKDNKSTPGRASSPTLSPVRSPIMQRTSSGQNRDQHDHHRVETELQQLRAKCQQLEHLNQALGQALDEERRMRKQEKSTHETDMAEAARREHDLDEMKKEAYRHNDDFRREFGELKDKLREQERQAESANTGDKGSERNLEAEVQRHKEQLQIQGMEHNQDIKTLEQDLHLARRGRETAEECSRMYRQELEEERNLHNTEIRALKVELGQAHVDEVTIAELERRLQDASSDMKHQKGTIRENEATVTALRNQIAKAKQLHEQDTSRAAAERARAVELAASFQRQVQELRQQLKEEQIAHESEVERLRSKQADSSQTSVQELDIVRAELDAKQNELNEAILERDEAKDALEARELDDESLKAELKSMKTINTELDVKISEKLQRRETYWKEKLEEADKERQLMAKALLHQWGREEVGIDSPQLYAYKYLSKNSSKTPVKSPTKGKTKAVV